MLRECIENFPTAFTCCYALGIGRECGQTLVPSFRKRASLHAVDLIREFRKLLGVLRKQFVPLGAQFTAALADPLTKVLKHTFRYEKLGVFRPPVVPLCEPNLFLA